MAVLPLLGGAVQTLPGSGTAAPRAAGVPAAAAADSARAAVSIHELTPQAPEEGDVITVSGRVVNQGRSTVTDARVTLRVGPRLTTRSAVGQAVSHGSTGGTDVGGGATSRIEDVAPGSSRAFTLRVPVEELPLPEPGTYPLEVSLVGRTAERAYDHTVGTGRSVLPWQPAPAGNEKRTRLTFLWPLISSSHVTARTEADPQQDQTPVLRSEELAGEIAPGGRLRQLVTLGRDLPVTWVVDPDLLASVEAMTGRYKVRTEDGLVAGRAQNHARQWLNDLQEAVQDREVVALPFGDPDLASLAHRGKNVSGALGHLGSATEVGGMTVETVLNVEPNTEFAWPAEGAVDPSIVSVATSAGADKVIARSDSLREPRSLTYTPTAARPIGGGTTAVVADARLSTLFQGDMTRASNSVAAVQQFLAETQSITAQRPEQQRSIVVAPQRMPTGSQVRTMATALEALQHGGQWAEFADLSEAADAEPDPRANRNVPGPGAYPVSLRRQELRSSAFEDVRTIQATLDDFKVILSSPDRVETPFGNALHRAMSTSWRGKHGEAVEYRRSMQSYLEGLTQGVRLVQKSEMKLSGRSATIPVTVQNDLLQTVEGLELRLTSGRRIGLDVGGPQPVRVEGGHSQSVRVPTTAKANGRTWVEAQLYTEEGERWGEPMRFQVEVTEITSTVVLVISGGVLLVFLAGIRMYTQRKRTGERPDPDAPLPQGGAGTGEAGTGHSSRWTDDRGSGTGSEGRGPSGAGERVER